MEVQSGSEKNAADFCYFGIPFTGEVTHASLWTSVGGTPLCSGYKLPYTWSISCSDFSSSYACSGLGESWNT